MIYIANALYLNNLQTLGQRPIIGYHSIIKTTNITTDSEDPDYPLLNLWNPETWQYWQSDVLPTTPDVYITITNGGADAIDYIGIAKHNFGTAGIEYTLEKSETGSVWEEVVEATTVNNDKAILHFFDGDDALYWRLKMTGISTPPQIAHMKLGRALILERPIYVGHTPGTLGPKAKRNTKGSETGQYLGQVITRRWYESDCVQENTSPGFVRTQLANFIDHVQSSRADDDTAQGSFFWAWRPASYPDEILYGWTDDDIRPMNQRANGMMSYKFGIQGVL